MLCAYSEAHSIKIVTISKANSRVEYAAEYIKKKLSALGYTFPIMETITKYLSR